MRRSAAARTDSTCRALAPTLPILWTAATWGSIEYENFNAASAVYTIHGVSVHPGSAKGRMVNANRLACELNALFPEEETPECTEGYEGFYHLCDLRGSVEECLLHYIIRDMTAPASRRASALPPKPPKR